MLGISRLLKYLDTRIIHKIGVMRARRLSRFLIGFLPVFGAFWFIVNVSWQIVGNESLLLGLVFKHAFLWMVLITILSIAYEFCWIHRAFVLYDYLISISIEHQIEVGFGELIHPIRIIKFAIGIVLFILFVKNNCWNEFFDKQTKIK